MKIILSEIDHIFDCAGGRCCSIVIENQKVKSATLLYIKDHQITKEYKGLKQLKDHSDEILQMSW